MKKNNLIFTFLFIILGSGILNAQNGWTKAQRQDIYNNCLNDLSMKRHISQEQRKALCLCYLQTLTEENSADKYLNMIDIEQETVNASAMDRCSKKLGISMEKKEEKIDEKTVPVNKSNLVGDWKLKNKAYTLYLNANGKFYSSTGEKGNWWTDASGRLVFSAGALSIPSKYDIVKLTTHRLIIRSRNSGAVEEYIKQ